MNVLSQRFLTPDDDLSSYYRRKYDGHGGHSAEHREEMRQIAEEVVNELAPKIAAQIYNESLERFIGALQYDIETIVSVSLEDAENLFTSSKCRKIISDRIMKEMKAQLHKIGFK